VAVDTDTEVSRTEETLTLAGDADSTTVSVPTDTHTLSLHLEPDGPAAATVQSPSGETVRSHDDTDGPMVDGPGTEWTVREPAAGTWTVAAEPRTATDGTSGDSVTAERATLDATSVRTANGTMTPDPREVLGYGQFDYKVSPLTFFDSDFFAPDDDLRSLTEERDLESFTDAAVDTLSVADVEAGAASGYDNLVVIHDDGIDDPGYVDALDGYVEAGGNLVVTDTGVDLLGAMDADLTGAISTEDTFQETYYVAHLGDKNDDQPLLEDARPVQNQLWKIAGLGYSTGTEAPMTLVDEAAFDEAGGVAAGTQEEGVSAGSLLGAVDGEVTTRELVESDAGAVHFVGGLFPPASQANLHPFGVLDYSASFLGYLLLTNALGYVQTRSIDGETTATFGGEATFEADLGGLTASGSRSDDATVFTGGQTNRMVLTVEELSTAAAVSDDVPDGWTVDPEYGDVEAVADGRVSFGEVGPVGEDDDPVELVYYADAPEGPGATGRYRFGPALAETGSASAAFAGTDDNVVVGPST
jgi:hypothetical protein